AGYVDRGAYEFQGVSSAPPLLAIASISTPGQELPNQISLQFSSPIAVADALNPSNYELRSAGPDHTLGTADDLLHLLQPRYIPGQTTLNLDISAGSLPPDTYQLTVFSTPGGGVHDLAGFALDGDRDGSPGGNYLASFTLYPTRLEFTSGPDIVYLRLAPSDPTLLQIFHNTSIDGIPTYSFPVAALSSLTLATLAGDDSITLDFSYGSPIPSAGLALDAATGSDNLRIIGTASDDALSLKPARLFFGSSVITYDNLESIRLDTLAGDDTLTLTATLPFAPIFNPGDGSNTLSIRAGSYDFTSDNLPATSKLHLIAAGSSMLNLQLSPTFASLSLANTARVTLAPGSRLLQTQSLYIASTATLDLTDGGLIVECPGQSASVLAAISKYVRTGRNNGTWTGAGIISSVAKPTLHKGLATVLHDPAAKSVIRSTLFTPPNVSAYVLVLYTWDGDVNCDGKVDIVDYFRVDAGFINQKPGYENGDLNYDGKVNIADYALIDSAFISQRASRSVLAAPVPVWA
ncbi:MAG TPA: dockerin type I repeat-containing protein, partial [Tepidisphaeraceae bacterium]|nr:dockerin type I repeat-containing protein [Tepidisphaeraceae bacterium]